MNNILYSAFTSRANGLANKLISNITLVSNNKSIDGKGQWDTGATTTCISEKVVRDLGLISTGRAQITTPSGIKIVGTYLIDIILPNKVMIKDIKVLDTDIGRQGIELLIGMDVILGGDFALTNLNKKTTISFVSPSMKEIDFIPEVNARNLATIKANGIKKK